jgi:ribonuclease HI
LIVEVALRFLLPTSKNQAKYEACVAGLTMAEELGAHEVKLQMDSRLMVSQIKGEYQDLGLARYLALVKEKMRKLTKVEVQYIPENETLWPVSYPTWQVRDPWEKIDY